MDMKVIAIDSIENLGRYKRALKLNKRVRNKKVRDIRREIESGKYDIVKKLDIAMDRLLEEILK